MTSNDDSQVFEAELDPPAANPSTGNCAGAFAHSFGHTLVQGPIDGVREVVNTLAGSKIVPKVELVKAPPKKEISTPEWEAQRIGAGAGLVAGLLIIARLMTRR